MGLTRRQLLAAIASITLLMAGCGGYDDMRTPPIAPSPTPVTANAYILPDAVSLGDRAFGDEPVVIHQGESLRWVNADKVTHIVVADSPDAIDFRQTNELPGGGAEQALVMTRLGMTGIHCAIHPGMTGILVVRER